MAILVSISAFLFRIVLERRAGERGGTKLLDRIAAYLRIKSNVKIKLPGVDFVVLDYHNIPPLGFYH